MSVAFIEMSFDNIYSFATCKVRFYSNFPFSVSFPSDTKLVGIECGIIKDLTTIKSVADKNIDAVKITVLGLMAEVPIECADGTGTVESYGMQYFPFLSALIKLNFNVYGATVGAVSVILPDKYRVIWFRQQLTVNDQTLCMTHSQGEKESAYVFTRDVNGVNTVSEDESEVIEIVNGTVPVRLGGKEYLRVVTFPSLYFGVSLIAVSLLALQNKPNLTFGAVAAFWILMLRHFNAANAPQLNTVLRDIYFLFGGILLTWAIFWEKFELKASIGIAVVLILYWGLRRINRRFAREGVLPTLVEKILYQLRRKNESKNKTRS